MLIFSIRPWAVPPPGLRMFGFLLLVWLVLTGLQAEGLRSPHVAFQLLLWGRGPASTPWSALPSLSFPTWGQTERGCWFEYVPHLTLGRQQIGQGPHPQLWTLRTSYSQNIHGTAAGAELGLPGVMLFPSLLPAVFWVYNQGEKCVCVWECWTERQRQTQRQTARDTDRWLHRWAGLCQRLVRWVFLPILLLPSLVSRPLPSNIYWVPTVLQPHTRWLAHLYVSLKLSSLLMSRLG